MLIFGGVPPFFSTLVVNPTFLEKLAPKVFGFPVLGREFGTAFRLVLFFG